MVKAFNITTLDVVTCVPLIIPAKLIIIEKICLVQSFPHRYDNAKINNGCDNFRKK